MSFVLVCIHFKEKARKDGERDVRISKRAQVPYNRLRGFEKGKVGPVDGTDHIGGNYATALNFEVNLPNFLPEATGADIGFFLDFLRQIFLVLNSNFELYCVTFLRGKDYKLTKSFNKKTCRKDIM